MPARRAVIAHGLYWIAFLLPGWAGRKALAAPHGNRHANEALPGGQRRQSNAEMEVGVEGVKADADVHAPPMPGRRIVDHGDQAPKEIQSTTISRFSWEENGRTVFETTRKETHAACSVRFRLRGGRPETRDQFQAPLSALDALQNLIDRHQLVKNNRFSEHVSGLPPTYGGALSVKYASGETLWISSNQSLPIPIEAVDDFDDYFITLAAHAGSRIFNAEPPQRELTYFQIEHRAPGVHESCGLHEPSGLRESYTYASREGHKKGRTARLKRTRQSESGEPFAQEATLPAEDMAQLRDLMQRLNFIQILAMYAQLLPHATAISRTTDQAYFQWGQDNDAVTFEANARIRQLDVLRDFLAQKLKARQP